MEVFLFPSSNRCDVWKRIYGVRDIDFLTEMRDNSDGCVEEKMDSFEIIFFIYLFNKFIRTKFIDRAVNNWLNSPSWRGIICNTKIRIFKSPIIFNKSYHQIEVSNLNKFTLINNILSLNEFTHLFIITLNCKKDVFGSWCL